MDLQVGSSIYQCNPSCNFEKKNKLQSSSVDHSTHLFERFEREREKQRKNYLNKMVSAHQHKQYDLFTARTKQGENKAENYCCCCIESEPQRKKIYKIEMKSS